MSQNELDTSSETLRITKHLDARFEQVEGLLRVARTCARRSIAVLTVILLSAGVYGYKMLVDPVHAAAIVTDARLSHIEIALADLTDQITRNTSTQTGTQRPIQHIQIQRND